MVALPLQEHILCGSDHVQAHAQTDLRARAGAALPQVSGMPSLPCLCPCLFYLHVENQHAFSHLLPLSAVCTHALHACVTSTCVHVHMCACLCVSCYYRYFFLTTAANTVALGSLILSSQNPLAVTGSVINLAVALAASLVNAAYIEPLASDLMFQR